MNKREKSFSLSHCSYKFFRSSFLSFLILFSTRSLGCLVGEVADLKHPELYQSIFTGMVESFEWKKSFFISDFTRPYIVYLTDVTIIRGEGPVDNKIYVPSGCGISIPTQGEFGLFFVEESPTGSVIPTYDSRARHDLEDMKYFESEAYKEFQEKHEIYLKKKSLKKDQGDVPASKKSTDK